MAGSAMKAGKGTVIAGFSRTIVAILPALGIRLSPALLQTILKSRDTRLSLEIQDQLWSEIGKQSDDPVIGLRIGAAMQLTNFDLLGFIALSSSTLEESTEALVEYAALIGEGGVFYQKQLANGDILLGYEAHFTVNRNTRVETILASLVQANTALMGPGWHPERVCLQHFPQSQLHQQEQTKTDQEKTTYSPRKVYEEILRCKNISFGAKHDAIIIKKKDLSAPISSSSPQVRKQMLETARQQISMLQPTSFAEQVRFLLCDQPWLNRKQASSLLLVSERQLNRKLQKESTSFRELSNESRKQEALAKIQGSLLTQASIAEELGYADENALAKALRRWTGKGFRELRNGSPDE